MTDRQGALGVLVSLDAPERQEALDAFYQRFHDDPLVLDKWFALQAAAQRPDTVDQVLKLAAHPDFAMTNPNRLRSLAGTFGANHWAFHSADGRGYAFLADMIIAADKLNPQVAARLVPPLGRWRRFEPKRAAADARGARTDRRRRRACRRTCSSRSASPGLRLSAADPFGDFGATWFAAWLSAGPTLAARAVGRRRP